MVPCHCANWQSSVTNHRYLWELFKEFAWHAWHSWPAYQAISARSLLRHVEPEGAVLTGNGHANGVRIHPFEGKGE